MKILILDNYDSFVYNIAQYVGDLGAEFLVLRNDEIDIEGIRKMGLSGIIISPGPGTPAEARDIGVCNDVIREMGTEIPILGVCLGHQAIVHSFGGRIVQAGKIMHGKTSMIKHNGHDIFKEIKAPLVVMRYHSLIADPETFPSSDLEVTARTIADNEILAIQHRNHDIFGVQFHPESIGTEYGKKMISNFLEVCDARQSH